jgi:uncharacterized cupredoxin-like copper-binding protein
VGDLDSGRLGYWNIASFFYVHDVRVKRMQVSFQHHHGAMLLKYSGISFISGAVNHGFFSGERSVLTAAVGVLLFVMGAVMEHRLSDNSDEPSSSLMNTLILGALLSIGLGFFTGGLQHFPDSPSRSAWVVPLGFFISVLAMAVNKTVQWRPTSTVYTVLAGLLISVSSYGAWQWLEQNPEYLGSHAHNDTPPGEHTHAQSPSELTALVVSRSIEIRLNDTMRFTPDSVQVQAGETIRLVVRNDGKVPHELVLGTEATIREHVQQMKQGTSHHHGHTGGAAIEVEPGKTSELVVHFPEQVTLQMACLIPGHYEAGMRGTLKVNRHESTAVSTPHDHSSHKH